MLEQPDAFAGIAQLGRVSMGRTGLEAVFTVRDLEPPLQTRLRDTEVSRDPADRASPRRATAMTSFLNSLANALGTLTILPREPKSSQRWSQPNRKQSQASLWPRKVPGHNKLSYDRAGLSGLHFHELRHTFATLALGLRALTMYELSGAMGHESEAVTNKVYAHLRKRDSSAHRAACSAFRAESAAPPAPLHQIGG